MKQKLTMTLIVLALPLIAIFSQEPVVFNFNSMTALPVSYSSQTGELSSTSGDITYTKTFTECGITLSISPKEDGNEIENRFWKTIDGPQLRCYSGTISFQSVHAITKITFDGFIKNFDQFNPSSGTCNKLSGSSTIEWDSNTDDTYSVDFSLKGNYQIDKITVYINIDNISFADSNVKDICVQNWDTDNDGELSLKESIAVTDLGTVFSGNTDIKSFDELLYFAGLKSIGDKAFEGCSGLTSVTIGNPVTSIGDEAFSGCADLTSVTIPNSVASIGQSAFSGCTGLTSVDIPNSVTSIGQSAFSGCTGLTSIEVESGNANYDSRNNCNAIIQTNYINNIILIAGCQNTVIPNSVTTIGSGAFEGCSGLTEVVIPNSVTTIGDGAFENCSGLTEVVIPNSVTSIGERAFDGCSGLTSVTIPNSVTSIGGDAFENCSGLTSVTIPSSVTSIGYRAFSGCSGLTSVTIPNSVTSIGWGAFQNCSGLTSVTIPNSVTSIENGAFQNCSGLTSITIGNSVTSIGAHAFDGCSELTSVTIPNSVTSIGYRAFSGCSGLTSVTIPNSVTSIENGAFQNCSGLTSVTIPNSVTSIGHYVFKDCSGLSSVTIGNSVTSIGNQTFWGCSSLTSVTIGNSVTSIGSDAFRDCTGLTSITIPNSVTSIGLQAFYGCSSLTSVTIPNSVTSIGEAAFHRCSSLTSVTIPNSVTSIGDRAFSGCSGMSEVIIPNSVTSIGYQTFFDCSDLTSVTIPNSVTSIGLQAFYGCSSLTSVIIPNSVTSIGKHAFWRCRGLTSVIIGNSVTSIGNEAFYECQSLTEVISLIEEPFDIETSVWKWVNTNKILLYVPAGTKEKYEATEGWNVFKTIIEMGIAPSEGEDINYGGGEISGETNLNGNVVGNIYYNIGDENGEYSSAEGCITLRTPVSDEQMSQVEGMDLFGEDMKNNFTGIIFMVQAGSGTIKVNAETTGNMVLKVKVGSGKPMTFRLNGQLDAELPYEVSEPTYVYIYGGSSSAAGAKGVRKVAGDGEVKIYGISWTSGTNGIETIDNGQLTIDNSPIYNLNGQRVESLQKGINIVNGKKVLVM